MAIRLIRSAEPHADEPMSDARAEACAFLVFRVLAETGSGAAVLHTGDTPYLEVPSGEIELARDRLTPAAMEAMARYLLPDDALRALRADGSVRSEWPILPELPDSRFTIVASLRHLDLWIEVRHTQPDVRPAAPAKPPAVRAAAHRDAANRTSAYAANRADGISDDALSVPSADELWAE